MGSGASGHLKLISSMISAVLTALVHILLYTQLFLWDDSQGMLLGPSACLFNMMVMLPASWENDRCQGVIVSAPVQPVVGMSPFLHDDSTWLAFWCYCGMFRHLYTCT